MSNAIVYALNQLQMLSIPPEILNKVFISTINHNNLIPIDVNAIIKEKVIANMVLPAMNLVNGVLYEIVGNSSYSANLDETVLPMFREKLKTALLMNGYMDIVKPIMWFDNWVEETIFPKIIERSDSLRGTGIYKYRIDWMFDQGCVLVSL